MSDPFVAEIRIVGCNFAPKGWAFCNGQLLPLSQNTALFSLLGTTYGGNGQTNFALPDLQGRSPMQSGQGPGLSLRDLGESGGSETVTLTQSQIPNHSHGLHGVSAAATTGTPGATVALAKPASALVYRAATNTVPMAAMAPAGAGQPHNNRQPYLVLNFIIALQGVYPPRT
jgi:microcystin-dependent protein